MACSLQQSSHQRWNPVIQFRDARSTSAPRPPCACHIHYNALHILHVPVGVTLSTHQRPHCHSSYHSWAFLYLFISASSVFNKSLSTRCQASMSLNATPRSYCEREKRNQRAYSSSISPSRSSSLCSFRAFRQR